MFYARHRRQHLFIDPQFQNQRPAFYQGTEIVDVEAVSARFDYLAFSTRNAPRFGTGDFRQGSFANHLSKFILELISSRYFPALTNTSAGKDSASL